MSNSLSSKHALICGGSDGLGYGAAAQLAADGARVTIIGRSKDKLEKNV